jgi:hypothetical protein
MVLINSIDCLKQHSCMDGTPTAVMIDHVANQLASNPAFASSEKPDFHQPSEVVELLEWELDDKAKSYIEKAEKEHWEACKRYTTHTWVFHKYGKEEIKKMKCS